MEKVQLPSKTWKWEFLLPEADGVVFQVLKQDQIVAESGYQDGVFTCSFLFDFSETPCTLSASAKSGDLLTICYLEYRIELYVNLKLCDEEWPAGRICVEEGTLAVCHTEITILPYSEAKTETPAVISSFKNAEGWHPEDKVWVGDCMPFSHDGIYHVFYLKDRRHHRSKWGKGAHQWAHISSNDLVHWNIHPMAIEIDKQAEGSICTGSVVYYGSQFYAFYAVRMTDGSAAPLRCAISNDGYHFTKSDLNLYISDRYRRRDARDPKVFSDENGLFHMFVTTSLRRGEDWQGCLAHLTSLDLKDWTEEEPALLTEVYSNDFKTPWSIEPECSDYFHKNGWYYLISRSHYWISRKPFGPWQQPPESHIPCGSVPKMALWHNRIIFTGFVPLDGYAGTLIFQEALQREDGSLEFIPLKEMKKA